jgi:hypothetical protein
MTALAAMRSQVTDAVHKTSLICALGLSPTRSVK